MLIECKTLYNSRVHSHNIPQHRAIHYAPPEKQAKELCILYIYQHFQDSEKMHQIEPESDPIATDDDSLYPYVNNDIEYGLFEDIVDSYYLDSQIKDDFHCDHDCYSQYRDLTNDIHSNACTHDYHHITQSIQDLTDSTQQNTLHSMEENVSSFIDDTDNHVTLALQTTFRIQKMQMIHIHVSHQNILPFTHKENMYTETLLVMHTYSTMTLTIKILSHSETNIQHYYNKNYKIHTGIYTTQ